ncbi:TolC family protein [Carboxylicivirga sp. M1479]|uniref:TolC family protein n=1 Tax=Carboxylicivirga sp. M1479 TaxID=2594476 RepID=UPI0011784174|nr:TolC family protein [Carboxylicivirga sp. M1479]TRX65928.1 TolC family protein [Carboxylicivirga sp. M1479]
MKNFILFIGLLISMGSFAQQKITLNQSRQMALDYNKSLKSAKLKHYEAEAQRKEARTAYLPNIDGTASLTYLPSMDEISIPGFQLPVMDAGGNPTDHTVGFPGMDIGTEKLQYYNGQVAMQVPIYMGGQIRYANQMADKGVEMAGQAYQLQTDDVVYNTDNAYWHLVAFKEQLKVAYKYYEMLDSLELQMKDMYDLGLTPKSEQLIVTVQKNEAQLNLMKAENAYRIMKMNLCQIIGIDLNSDVELVDTLLLEPKLMIMENGVQQALVNRNELKMLDGQVSISELQKKSSLSMYKPQLGAQLSYGYMEIPNLVDGQTLTQASAQLSIPIVHWREKKHKKEAAQLRVQQAQLQLDETKDFVQLEVQQYMIRVNEAYEAILLANKNKDEAIESLDEVTASFDAGLNTTTDVLNAQASWLSANADLLNALAGYEVAKIAYLKGIGALKVMDTTDLNQL